MREAFTALKSGELTKFSSRRDISSEVSHLFHFIFHRDPRYSRRGITKNIKQHMAQSCPSTSYSYICDFRLYTRSYREHNALSPDYKILDKILS